MDVKYTFRDLIVYFLTGFTCVALFLIVKPQYLDTITSIPYFEDKDNGVLLAVLISVPVLYILGHVIQIFDLIISFYLARPMKKYRFDKAYEGKKYRFHRLVYFFLAASTAEYQYQKRNITQEEFNKQKYTLIVQNKNTTAEYYYLVRELFNGLRVFTFFLLLYMLFDWPGIMCFGLFIILYFIFWIKAYNSAKNFTYEITKVYNILQTTKTGING